MSGGRVSEFPNRKVNLRLILESQCKSFHVARIAFLVDTTLTFASICAGPPHCSMLPSHAPLPNAHINLPTSRQKPPPTNLIHACPRPRQSPGLRPILARPAPLAHHPRRRSHPQPRYSSPHLKHLQGCGICLLRERAARLARLARGLKPWGWWRARRTGGAGVELCPRRRLQGSVGVARSQGETRSFADFVAYQKGRDQLEVAGDGHSRGDLVQVAQPD